MMVVPFGGGKKGTSEKDQVKVGDNTSRIQVQYKLGVQVGYRVK